MIKNNKKNFTKNYMKDKLICILYFGWGSLIVIAGFGVMLGVAIGIAKLM